MPNNAILHKMLDRLFAAMANSASLNCRPHHSRQRIDLSHLDRLKDIDPRQVLIDLLGEARSVKLSANVPPPPDIRKPFEAKPATGFEDDEAFEPKEDESHHDWRLQRSLLHKLKVLGDDARTYEQDTGVHALYVGYPLLSMPPGATGGSRRVLAPIAFIPVTLTVKTGHKAGVELSCYGEGSDLVIPNQALMAYLERQTGKPAFTELFDDESGEQPWREVRELVEYAAKLLDIKGVTEVEPAEADAAVATRREDEPQAPPQPSEAPQSQEPDKADESGEDEDDFSDDSDGAGAPDSEASHQEAGAQSEEADFLGVVRTQPPGGEDEDAAIAGGNGEAVRDVVVPAGLRARSDRAASRARHWPSGCRRRTCWNSRPRRRRRTCSARRGR